MLIGVLPTGPFPAQARGSPVTQGSALAPTRLPGLPDWPRHFHSLPANHPWLFTRSAARRPFPRVLLCLPAPQPTPGHLSCPSVCLFFFGYSTKCGILVPRAGIKSVALALEAQSVNQGGPSSHSLMSPPQAHFSQAPGFPSS